MKQLYQQLMKSIKYTYQEDKKDLNFEEFYFNGIPTPNKLNSKIWVITVWNYIGNMII